LPLDDPEVAAFLARVRSLAGWMPELELPPFDDNEIRALLPALAAGRKSFAELRRAPLLDVLQGALSYEQREAVRREAPERRGARGRRAPAPRAAAPPPPPARSASPTSRAGRRCSPPAFRRCSALPRPRAW